MNNQGLHSKLIKAFLLQIALISVATLSGVFFAEKIVEKVLVRQALIGEAAHFWKNYQLNPNFPKPDTLNLKAYLAENSQLTGIPPALQALKPGYCRTELESRKPIVYVEDLGQARLYLIFDEQQVAALAFYFGVVPLGLVLALIYLFAWLSYRQSRQAISPVIQLARYVEKFDFRSQNIARLDFKQLRESSDSDVIKLMDALSLFTERMQQFIQREKNFTRDASHELRTPLAVIKSALGLLQKRQDYSPPEQKSLQLIDATLRDMESLIETLLLLAREEAAPLPEEEVLVNDLLITLVEQIQHALGRAGITVQIQQNSLIAIPAAEKVLGILFTNLLRNAFSYTAAGGITVTIDDQQVSITDTGIGMNQQQLQQVFEPFYRAQSDHSGHGLGLTIVKQLCTRYGWKLKIRSKPGEGTMISVLFPKAKLLGKKNLPAA
ncbi:MAG: HAMP domain-containing sensor histidine kinase [Methylococcales bacterium]